MTLSKPYIISICSGKGGVGKSFLAGNLASETARMGCNTLVIDGDRQFPNQHLIMGAEPPLRLSDAVDGKIKPSEAAVEIHDNLSLIAEMPASLAESKFDQEKYFTVFKDLIIETNFDIIIIDTAAGACEESLFFCDLADLDVIVVNDEPTAVLDAYALLKILLSFRKSNELGLLVNNVIDLEDAEEVSGKLNLASERFLGHKIPYIGFVPYDRQVRKSIIRQELYADHFPHSELSKELRKTAEFFAEQIMETENY